ncbi:MAG: hypothetical protein D6762_07430 [Candidatus Neomarinimicrobiota bacterium]|nr:MAG: hypothetical protein D6762_07430 [Candidatus Neomarinimicrobiota bacterium]
MELPFRNLHLIWNPAAGGHRGEERWLTLKTELDRRGIPYVVQQTEEPGHATRIVREWLEKEEVDRLGIVGGDGTFNEAVNGAFRDGKNLQPDCRWMYLAAGSSCDFEKKFSTGHSSMEKILGTEERSIDIGAIAQESAGSAPDTTYFVNNSSIGVISLANDKFNAMTTGWTLWVKRISVDLAAILAGLQAIGETTPSPVVLTLDGDRIEVPEFSNLTIYKTRYFGGGMAYNRGPEPADGRFGVAWIEAASRWKLTRLIPTLYTGTVLEREEAHYREGRTIEVNTPAPMVIEADGQVVGTTPAHYSLLPKALKVII